ncbi:Exocyst complex component sec10 [Vanrija pseudolonga]|uniref:Exocyst complex component sec10 n=1 Tax=Vanrija pseudolonga TaxID=143232 RepID=A0AAF0YFD6_9TREE|nr:Exocyst complex component sec10 [Vanrija pseudolonga]
MSSSPASATPPPRRPAKRNTLQAKPPDTPPRRDPAIQKALQLSTLKDGYSTEEFMSTLSEKLVAESKATPGPFNPTPFMQTFSPALDALLALRSQVGEETKAMESDVRRAHREYGKRLRELDSGFEAVGNSFSTLEGKINDVGRTAARIGEQLESLHQTRSTAQATSLLLTYYFSLVQFTSVTQEEGTPSPLDSLYSARTSRNGRERLALVLRRLMAVAKDVADNASAALDDADAAENAADDAGKHQAHRKALKARAEKERADRVRDEVEKYCEKFEKEVLRLFDKSYRKGDPRMMQHCAKVLQEFNGGKSCVQIYVNQHDFFIQKDNGSSVREDVDADVDGNADIWSTIGDPDAPPPTVEGGLQSLFAEIRSTVSQEAQIVRAVFPNPITVMQVFLERVFGQVIQQRIESLVSRASGISTLAMLRILQLSHVMCTTLVDDLKAYDASLGNQPSRSSKVAADSNSGPLAALLDQSLQEIFVPWLEGSRYLDLETKNLVELYAGLLARFSAYHEAVAKVKPTNLLDRVVNTMPGTAAPNAFHAGTAAMTRLGNMLSSSATSVLPGNSSRPVVPSRSMARLSLQGGSGNLTPTNGPSRQGSLREDPADERRLESDGQVSIVMAERMLRWHAEAVGRVVELSGSADVGKNAFALSKVLAEAIGRSYIGTALDSVLARLEQQESKTEPDLTTLTVLHPVDLVCHLFQRYASTALIPLTGPTTAVRREITAFNQHNVMHIEGKTNEIIQKAIDLIVSWLSTLLQKQRKTDYKPKDDDWRGNTEPCVLSCEFLGKVKDIVDESMSGKNSEAVLTEVGVAFHALLLDHYKKYPINQVGGIMLSKDLASYQEAIVQYGIPPLNDRFDMLRQLGNSFFITKPEELRSYLTEPSSHLGRVDLRLLRPYLEKRSDWSTVSRSMALDDPATFGDSPAGSGAGTPGARKANRLSAMAGALTMARLFDSLRDYEPDHQNGDTTSPRKKDKEGGSPALPPSAFSRQPSTTSQTQTQGRAAPRNMTHMYLPMR